MTNQEKLLLNTCIKGEKAGWEEFICRYSKLIQNSIRKTLFMYHHPASTDVVQEVYQELLVSLIANGAKKLGQFKGENECSLASWVRVLASRSTIDFLRREKNSHRVIGNEAHGAADDVTKCLIDRETRSLLERVCLSLSPREQKLLRLHYQNELSPQEVADVLQISPGAFYTQKSRILNKLRRALATHTVL